MTTAVTRDKVSAENLRRTQAFPACGAVCSFEGVVRNHHEGRSVAKLEYEAYAPLAEKILANIVHDAEQRWPGCQVSAMHRIGRLEIGDVTVAITVWAPHRKEAFIACEWVIDRIKQILPVWKKEFYVDGSTAWIMCQHGGKHEL